MPIYSSHSTTPSSTCGLMNINVSPPVNSSRDVSRSLLTQVCLTTKHVRHILVILQFFPLKFGKILNIWTHFEGKKTKGFPPIRMYCGIVIFFLSQRTLLEQTSKQGSKNHLQQGQRLFHFPYRGREGFCFP